ncbi:hypothetical protein GALMADRAFT_140422 [Galerina marginata CBS 339.88]|uniref:Uncharacterized protein n=1 Tax=Galerina marginata (strain CBS 339.88) TaxID=685588 RepID=A0A067T0H8_GALM3|nr:hypothetical protein GALMADRAFT_140422 [Galerina marginata CBS 339.88]
MAKNAKKFPANHGKPITAFFTRSSKAPPATQHALTSSTPTSSTKNSAQASEDSKGAIRQSNSSDLVSISPSTTNEIAVNRDSVVSPPRKSSTTSTSQVPVNLSTAASSLKRSRSPETRLSAIPSTPKRLPQGVKSPGRRKGKFDSDSETETNTNVVFVKYTPNPQTRKKARLSSPLEVPPLCKAEDVVPSSQSDEEELSSEVKSNVKGRVLSQQQTRPPPSELNKTNGIPMNMDEYAAAELGSTSTSSLASGNILGELDGETQEPTFTHPSSGLPSMPPTPVALDAASKTAKIIADIKARAYARSLSSPESTPLKFNEQLDDSSDDEDILSVMPIQLKKASSPTSSTATAPAQRSTRYSLRNRSPSSPSRNQPSTSQITSRKSSSSVSAKQHGKKPVTTDPFELLLKEKNSAEKRGNGNDAFRLAEITASMFNIDGGNHLDDADFDEGENSMDWSAATQAARDSDWLLDKPLTPSVTPSGGLRMNLGKDHRKRIFGESGGSGKIILDILEQDKAAKRQAELSEKVPGLQLWSGLSDADSNSMEVYEDISSRSLHGDSQIVHLFNASLAANDLSQAALALNMDIMQAVEISERAIVSSCLVDFALSPQLSPLSEPATGALEHFWSSTKDPLSSSISFAQVLNTIHRLGMDPAILTARNWQVPNTMEFRAVDPSYRTNVVRRLIVLVNACASSARLKLDELPDILIAMLLLGMDSGASPDILRDVSQAVEKICHCIPPDLRLEIPLSSKLLACVASYEPINKDRFLSLLFNGAGSTRRIADLVAYCIITEKEPEQWGLSSDLSPLREVLDQLIPYSRSATTTPGKFALHEQTDYVDLGFYVSILAVAVSDIRGYVAQERQTFKSKKQADSLTESPTKNGEKPKTDLQLLHLSLETLHSNISDTRATHLERSRTKAIIKGLAMIIHYQRETWLRNDPERSKTTLAQYFKKKDKSETALNFIERL